MKRRAYVPVIIVLAVLFLGTMPPGSRAPRASTGPEGKASAGTMAEPVAAAMPAAPVAAMQPANPAVAPTRAPEGPPLPAIVWRQRSPGYPLTSDDPAAAGKRVAMLTFDDGPGPGTARILDVLAENQVKAIFFIMGRSAARHPDLVERIHREGHALGVHTVTHPNLTRLTPDQMRAEISPVVDLIEKVSGEKPRYIRPPYGAYNKEVAAVVAEYKMEIINWNTGSLDWDGVNAQGWKEPKLVVDDVMRQIGRGSIILFHDIKKHTAEALPEIIRRMREAGYEFVTLP